MRRWSRTVGWIAATFIGALLWAWVAGSLYYLDLLPKWADILLVLTWAAGPMAAGVRFGWRRTGAAAACFSVGWAIAFHGIQQPQTDRNWAKDQTRHAMVEFSNDRTVEIQNIRNYRYRTPIDYDEAWSAARYNLDDLRTIDFVLEPLTSVYGMAHTLLSFGFADGRHVAISVEIRKQVGESYSPLGGMFRQYELIYIIADERDVVALRLNARKHDIYIYPLRATPDEVRHLFESMLHRAMKLSRDPEFYHTLTSTCTTNLVRHFDQMRDEPLGMQWRALLPLFSDELAWDLNLIDKAESLDEARQRYLVKGPQPVVSDSAAYSRQLRAGRSGSIN
jgi:hypothetical protein